MRVSDGERLYLIGWQHREQVISLSVNSAKHGVSKLAGTDSVANFRELDRLRNRCIRGNAPHVKKLVNSEPKKIEQCGFHPSNPAIPALATASSHPSPF